MTRAAASWNTEARDRRRVGAIDVGATKTLVAVARLPLEGWDPDTPVIRLPTPPTPEELATAVVSAVAELAGGRPVDAVGIGAPGPLDAARGIVRHSPNQGWRDVSLAELVSTAVGAPAFLDDDANLGALGEWNLGSGRHADPLVYLTLSTGIGSGMIVGGRAVRGAHGSAGEVGHLAVRPDGPRCSCGARGHVEAYAGGAALVERAAEAWAAAGHDHSRRPNDASQLFSLAASGDSLAVALVEDAVLALSVALAALVATVDPARIVVGGSLALGNPTFLARAAALASQRTLPGHDVGSLVVPAALGASSVLAGAAILAVSSQ